MQRLLALIFCVLALGTSSAFGQDQEKHFGVEFTTTFWIPDARGLIQSKDGTVDLRSDLGVVDRRLNSLMRLLLKFGDTHRLVIEGTSLNFTGTREITTSIRFSGTNYEVQDTIYSQPTVQYVFAGYAREALRRGVDRLQIQFGAAYLRGKGHIESLRSGLEADLSRGFPLPIAGVEYQHFLTGAANRFEISGDASGMTLGSFGHYFKGAVMGGARLSNHVVVHAGYAYLSLDAHRNDEGVDLVFRGPVVKIEFRDR